MTLTLTTVNSLTSLAFSHNASSKIVPSKMPTVLPETNPNAVQQKPKGLLSRFLDSNHSIFLGVFTAEILEFIIKHPLLLMIAAPFLAVFIAYKATQKVLDPVLTKLKNWSTQKLS